MLDTLRRGASSKLAAILLFLPLIVAFSMWGIGPEWRGGTGGQWVAKVGNQPIYPEEFQRAYQNELEQMSNQFGRRITAEQGRMFGLDQRVLQRLASAAALDQQTAKMGLSVSTQSIVDSLRADTNFQEIDGKFSKQRFDYFLRQIGFSEQGYFAQRKKDEMRVQLSDSIITGVVPPKAMIDLMHTYNEETRVVEHVTVDPAKVVTLAEPDDAALKKFFDENSKQFVAPETRKAAVLLLTRENAKARVAVSPEDIKDTYESTKERYNVPEQRRVYQMAFPDKAAAEKAQPELAKAKNFSEAAVKLGAKISDIDLGMQTKKRMVDQKIADAVFALKKDEVSQAIEGVFTTVVAVVTDINAGKQRTLEDVAAEVKESLQTQRAGNEIQALQTQIEDDRSAGKSAADIAQKFGLTFLDIPSIDRGMKGADGKSAITVADAPPLTNAIFAGAVGLDAEPIDLADGGLGWVTVLGVTAQKDRTLEEAKTEVKAAWTEAETRKLLGDATARFVERLIKGEAIATIAAEAGGKVEKTNPITRTTSPPGLTTGAVQQAFSLPKGAASSALTTDSKTRTIFRVVEVTTPPAATPEQIEKIKSEMTRSMQADAFSALAAGLQQRAGYNVNMPLLQQVMSGGQAQ